MVCSNSKKKIKNEEHAKKSRQINHGDLGLYLGCRRRSAASVSVGRRRRWDRRRRRAAWRRALRGSGRGAGRRAGSANSAASRRRWSLPQATRWFPAISCPNENACVQQSERLPRIESVFKYVYHLSLYNGSIKGFLDRFYGLHELFLFWIRLMTTRYSRKELGIVIAQ